MLHDVAMQGRCQEKRSCAGGNDYSLIDRNNSRADKSIGMEDRITRRDFLNATLLASGSLLLNPVSPADLLAAKARPSPDDWTGYGGTSDYANSNGNTLGVLEAGHHIRDGGFGSLPASV